MSRLPGLLAVGLVGCLAAGAVRAEEEPTFRGRTLSAWAAVLTGDADVRRRQGALIALERIGPLKSAKTLPAVVAALTSKDQGEAVRAAAAGALGRMYDRVKEEDQMIRWDGARDGLAAAVRTDRSPAVREAAATALGRMGADADKAVPELKGALSDPQMAVRSAAAEALRNIAVDRDAAKDVADALPELERLLKDKNADRLGRASAALAIGQVGAPEAVAAVGTLADAAADAKAPAEVRKAAAEALGRLGENAGAAAGRLGSALSAADAPPEVRRAAVEALNRLGPAAKPALAALKKAVGDDDIFIRVEAMHALGRLGPVLDGEVKGVVAVLLPRIDDDVVEVRVAAVQAVGALGKDALGPDLPLVTARLTQAAGDSRPEVRVAATAALARLKGKPSP